MPHRKRNIYKVMYSTTLLVVLCYFGHNVFQPVNYDVLHVEETFYIGETAIHMHDLFPFYDAPGVGYYGEVVRMDIQNYLHTLGVKVMLFAMSLTVYRLLSILNILLAEIPGRRFEQLPYFQLVLVVLFGYDVLDFVFRAGQTHWIAQLLFVIGSFLIIAFIKRKADA